MRAVSPAIAAAERAIANGLHTVEFKQAPTGLAGGKARELVSAFIHGTMPDGATPLWMDNKTGTVAQWSNGMVVPTDPDGALHAARVGQLHLLITASTPDPTWGAAMIADSLQARGHRVSYVPTSDLAMDSGRLVDTRTGGLGTLDAVDGISVRTGAHLTDRDMGVLADAERAGLLLFNGTDALANIRTKRATAAFAERVGIAHPPSTFIDLGQERVGIAAALDTFDGGAAPVVIKATDGMGGKDMVFLEPGWSEQSVRSIADVLMDKPGRKELQVQRWIKEASGDETRGAQDERLYFIRDGNDIYFPPNVMVRTGAKGKAQSNISADGKASPSPMDADLLKEAKPAALATGLDYGSIDFVRGAKTAESPKGPSTMLEINSAAGYGPEENVMAGAPLHDITADMMIRRALSAKS